MSGQITSMIWKLFTPIMAAVLLLGASDATAEPEKPPRGLGKYVMVLWEPGTPLPDGNGHAKRADEPDVEKQGGRVLKRHANFVEIFLPLDRAKGLRRHPAVSYLQRIWMGEPLDEWDETYPVASGRPAAQSDSETTATWGPHVFSYDGSGNITQLGPNEYVYDTAGRLVSAEVNGKLETYKYDSFGNLTEKAVSGSPVQTIDVDPQSNRLADRIYDAAGNVTGDVTRSQYVYDGAGSLVWLRRTGPTTANTERFIYDAADERLGRVDPTRRPAWTIRDLNGRVLREFQSQDDMNSWTWYWKQDYVYADGILVSGANQTFTYNYENPTADIYGGERHYHLDHLGSVRIISDKNGRTLAHRDYYPYGVEQTQHLQEQPNFADSHIDKERFAGHTRDYFGVLDAGNNYLDYMHARYYDPTVGRFMSVDPILGEPSRPQTWNRYSYVNNSPINLVDPTGMYETMCGANLDCQQQAVNFETARTAALESSDPAARAAAAAYGGPGEANNVWLTFATSGADHPADTGAYTAYSSNMTVRTNASGDVVVGSQGTIPVWGVVVTFNGSNGITPANVAHEGVHVAHALSFFHSWNGSSFNDDLRTTSYATESAAYHVTASFTPRNGQLSVGKRGQHVFRWGMTVEQKQAVIDAILRDPDLKYNVTPQNQGGQWPP